MLFLQNTRIVDEHQSEKTRNQFNNSIDGSKQYAEQISPKTMFEKTIVP